MQDTIIELYINLITHSISMISFWSITIHIISKYSWKNLSTRTIIGNSLRGYKQYSMYLFNTNYK